MGRHNRENFNVSNIYHSCSTFGQQTDVKPTVQHEKKPAAILTGEHVALFPSNFIPTTFTFYRFIVVARVSPPGFTLKRLIFKAWGQRETCSPHDADIQVTKGKMQRLSYRRLQGSLNGVNL